MKTRRTKTKKAATATHNSVHKRLRTLKLQMSSPARRCIMHMGLGLGTLYTGKEPHGKYAMMAVTAQAHLTLDLKFSRKIIFTYFQRSYRTIPCVCVCVPDSITATVKFQLKKYIYFLSRRCPDSAILSTNYCTFQSVPGRPGAGIAMYRNFSQLSG